jgi:hypothetical protein
MTLPLPVLVFVFVGLDRLSRLGFVGLGSVRGVGGANVADVGEKIVSTAVESLDTVAGVVARKS